MICNAGSSNVWASSGSRSAINSVEPLRSTKSTVTCLRSPSRAAREVRIFSAKCLGVYAAGVVKRDSAGGFVSIGCPHSRQNFAPAGNSVLHAAHISLKRAPHSRQNFACGGFSCWHWGHCMLFSPGFPQIARACAQLGWYQPQSRGRYLWRLMGTYSSTRDTSARPFRLGDDCSVPDQEPHQGSLSPQEK